MIYLFDFETVATDHYTAQQTLNDQLHALAAKSLVEKYACKPDYVAFRGHELQGYRSALFEPTSESTLRRKVDFFDNVVFRKLSRLYEGDRPSPDLLTHVSCTGYKSPSAVQRLISGNEWQGTGHLHIYHMGCYAAFPAIRASAGELYRRKAMGESYLRADVFHSELTSLHFDAERLNPEQMVVQTLFADGYIRYGLSIEPIEEPHFRVQALHEELIPASEKMMTWDIGEPSFRMTLSRQVPVAIGRNIQGFVDRLLQKMPVKPHVQDLLFAIHPGGPRIIDQIQDQLQLTDDQVLMSREILHKFGNMSSATLPVIWKSLLPSLAPGQQVISFAFGPGLTICGSIMERAGRE